MKSVITTEKAPIKMWLDDIEDGALEQAKDLANLPFVFKHVALMPDCHQGYGMPIGGVLATHGVVIPNAVGVDIGCGMCAVKTYINKDDLSKDVLTKIIKEIKRCIPVGFNKNEVMCDDHEMPQTSLTVDEVVLREYDNARLQLGTLGGGNHFIEIQADERDDIWIMIHSGSRNIGNKVATHYHALAKKLNDKWYSNIPNNDLAFLPLLSEQGRSYMEEMNYCVDFAYRNRMDMMNTVMDIFVDFTYDDRFDEPINIAHNYARLENHFGRDVMVHRKGATSAKKGQKGIIPGSQGTSSYIVEGLGNPDSFTSCSHGAGRNMGRKEAQRKLNLKDELKKMEGILHNIKTEKDLDESPSAYKDIDVVMEYQKDLVKILTKLTPLAVIKG